MLQEFVLLCLRHQQGSWGAGREAKGVWCHCRVPSGSDLLLTRTGCCPKCWSQPMQTQKHHLPWGAVVSCSGESQPPSAKTPRDSSWHRELVSALHLLLLQAHKMLMGVCQVPWGGWWGTQPFHRLGIWGSGDNSVNKVLTENPSPKLNLGAVVHACNSSSRST